MDDLDRDLPQKEQLFDELERLIKTSEDLGINVYEFKRIFKHKYGIIPEKIAKLEGYSDLKSCLRDSGRFLVYGSLQCRSFFYISLLPSSPKFKRSKGNSVKYRVKRPWNLDREMKKFLKSQNRICQPKSIKAKIQSHQFKSISEIESVNDLKIALTEIVHVLARQSPRSQVKLEIVSQNFYDYYRQPIRSVMKTLCPGVKLLDLLQSIPDIQVKKVDNRWLIDLNEDSE